MKMKFFASLAMLLIFSLFRNVYATSSGYERYKDDYCEVYIEYFPILPYDPNYPTASEEFVIKFYVIQNDWWNWLVHHWPSHFIVAVWFRDDTCGEINYVTWKRWYPTTTTQNGWKVSWSLSGAYGPLSISATVSTPDSHFETNYDKYYDTYPGDGKVYLHLSHLVVDYNDNILWGSTYTEGAGSLGVPNDLAQPHEGHHIKIIVQFRLYWWRQNLFDPLTLRLEYEEIIFVIGDDIPIDTDCLLYVQQGNTDFFISHGGDGGGGGCPTLFVWNGADYADEGVLNIHAESDITVQHEIESSLALENGVYKLQLRELDEFTSHIDQVKLYAVDYEGEWHICPLIYASHNELGKVTQKLLFDDNIRVDLEPTETIDLNFLPSIPYSQTAHFVFEINGYNMKQP